MEFRRLDIPDVVFLTPRRFADARGWFSETYNEAQFLAAGIECKFIQDNHSYSKQQGTIRGLHLQLSPFAQAKLVRAIHGSIYDVAVDLRRASPTFGKFVAVTLTAKGGEQLFIPTGFAHGYCTLEPDTEVLYKVDQPYAPKSEAGIIWNDADVSIPWPVRSGAEKLSDKDLKLIPLRQFESSF
jgi:dTDP-4-dehydrorhamnose 3,5-epimerase